MICWELPCWRSGVHSFCCRSWIKQKKEKDWAFPLWMYLATFEVPKCDGPGYSEQPGKDRLITALLLVPRTWRVKTGSVTCTSAPFLFCPMCLPLSPNSFLPVWSPAHKVVSSSSSSHVVPNDFIFLLSWPFTIQLVPLLETTLPSLRHMLLFLGLNSTLLSLMGHTTLHGHYHFNWLSLSIFSRDLGAGTISWLCYPGTNRKS